MGRIPPPAPEPGRATPGAILGLLRKRVAAAATVAACVVSAAGCASSPSPEPPHLMQDAARARDISAEPPGPHDSLGHIFDSHFSAQAWDENVVDGYFNSASIFVPLGLSLAAGGIASLDDRIAERARDTSPAHGHLTLGALLAGTAAIGLFAPGEGRSPGEERWTIVESLVLTVASTQALNAAVGRLRPNESNDSSFPSGHTSTAFAAATLIDRNSGHWWGIPAYALATATALSRVEARRHFPSDVLAGAALGCLTAGIIDSLHFGGDEENRGISRRHVSTQLGFEVDPQGRPTVALTLGF